MLAVAALLGVFALLLAWPVPVVLSRAAWPSQSPAVALALWQAIALGGGLSMIGCLLVFGSSPAGSLLAATGALLPHLFIGPIPPEFGVVHLAALTLAAGLAAHLALNLALTAVRAERERRRQHQLIALLGDPLPGEPRTRVLAHSLPLAYCVPGIRTATVLTEGLIEALGELELRAVIAHERAHLDQLHHLVLLAFRAWHSALPWFPIANRAERSVALLAEMLADDEARHAAGDDALRRAMLQVGSGGEPGAYADSGGVVPDIEMLEARLARLGGPVRRPPRALRLAVVSAAVLIVALPIAALLVSLGGIS
ncbi:M56 family metallopeptidase [Agromyces subbeticus]|uniref:M56 family metallopeptidase n=1 Tax=Agromyces subbeticus TaxID=293890 RepID=UPI0003B383FD|nr:M56 family metallopeptidase [Agromyces subbeticus]